MYESAPILPKLVLTVDDDPVSLKLLKASVNRLGYDAVPATSVDSARTRILVDGAESFACVLTDYRMPDGNGLELLIWLQDRDRTLSTIILTGEGDKEVVEMTLKQGASAYLDKPASLATLKESISKAVTSTMERRRLAEVERQADRVGDTLYQMLGIHRLQSLHHLRIYYHPHSLAGGDSISTFQLKDQRECLLMADVSGHDLTAAYLSAYFKGLVRGLTWHGMEIRGLLDHVNRFLIQEWGADAKAPGLNSSIQISIAVCGVEIDRESVRLSVMNNGSPCPTLTSANGFSLELGTGSPPLGWFDDPETEVIRHAFEDGGHLLLWSDGLVDCADECGVLPHSLAYRLLHSDQADLEEKVIPHSRDDILLMRMDLSLQPDEREGFFPLIVANYNGDQAASIDELQQEWKRSLSFSLPSYSESIMDDVLLCSREAVLNAMKHGCHADAGLTCSFQVAYRPETLTLRVRVEDSGAGYEDEFLRNTELLEDDALMRHCGLILIREIPDRVEVERKGALLTLDFDIIGHCEKIRSTFCS